ncbi:MAG: hypothetical protein AAF567_09525 [Actinomycetota bacterium]
MTGDRGDGWIDAMSGVLDEASDELDTRLVNAIVHAPMPPRVRNELINRGYAAMADRLGALLYPEGVPESAAPNFFCFAHWASSYVGERMDSWRGRFINRHLENGNAVVFHSMTRAFLAFEFEVLERATPVQARREIDRRIPPVARVNADVDQLMDTQSVAVVESLLDPVCGLPGGLVDAVARRGLGSGALLQAIRERGFAAYRRARTAGSDGDRRRAILEGTAWLVISEQAMVDPALTRAMRSLVRSALSPWKSLRSSRRDSATGRVGPIRHGFEDAWIELLSKTLEWPAPEGVMPGAEPVRFRPAGPASVHRWLVDGSAELPRGEPFDWFRLPEVKNEPLFWTALAHRLPVIFSVLQACHDGPWFDAGHMRRHPGWDGFRAEMGGVLDRMTPDRTNRSRAEDWAVASRLFERDRALIYAVLFTRSLPATYASPHGAALLDLRAQNVTASPSPTASTMVDDSLGRLRRSRAFVDAMFSSAACPGSSDDTRVIEGKSKEEWLHHVGNVHAMVRSAALQAVADAGSEVVDPGLLRDPLGYEQSIGAGVSFVVPVVEGLAECFGVHWSREERDSWSRVWVEIARRQGLAAALARPGADDWLGWSRPLETFSYDDLKETERRIRNINDRRSLAGVRLANKLRQDLEDALPALGRPLVNLGLAVFGDDDISRILMIPPSRSSGLAKRLSRRCPRLTRRMCERFIDVVLCAIEKAPPIAVWDEVYTPSFRHLPRSGRISSDHAAEAQPMAA